MAWWTDTRRTRVLLLFGLVATVMLCLLAYFGLSTWRNRLADTEERIHHQARLIAAQHNNVISGTRQFVQLTTGTADLEQLVASPRCAAVMAKWFGAQQGLADLGIALPNGDIVCSAIQAPRKINLFDRPYFQQALKTSGLVIGQAVTSRGSGKWGLPFAQSIQNDQGRLVGVLVAIADLSGLGKALAEGNDIAGSRIGLVDARGLVMARYPDPERWTGKSIANEPLFRLLQALNGSGTGEEIGLDGVSRIFAYVPFAKTADGPVHLWLGVSKDAVMAGIKRDLAWTLGGALVVLMLTLAAIVVATSRELRAAKQAEEALQRSEQRWQFALEGAGQGVWDWDLVEQKAYYSPVLQALVGHEGLESSDTRETNYFFEWIHPDDVPTVVAEIERHLRGETELMHHEFRMRHRDGHYIWVESRGKITERDEQGRPIRVTGTNADITKAHEAERALRISQQRWQFALEGAEQGVWDWDLVEQKAYYSPVFQAMLGHSGLEYRDTADLGFLTQAIHPDDLQNARAEIDRHLRGETELMQHEFRLRHHDGHYIWVASRGKITERDAEGRPIRITGTNTDITKAHEAQRALRISEQRWQFALEGSEQGVWDWDLVEQKAYYSPVLQAMLGYARSAASDDTSDPSFWMEWIHPDDVQQVRVEIERLLRDETQLLYNEYRMRHSDGYYVWILTRGKITERDAQGKPTRMTGTNTDVTRAHEAARALRDSQRLYRSLGDALPMGLFRLKRGGEIVYANQYVLRMMGATNESEVLGRNMFQFTPEPDRANALAQHQRVVDQGISSTVVEAHIVPGLGTVRYQEITRVPVFEEDGSISGEQGVFRDVTEQVLAQQQLRLHALVFESTHQGIAVMDPDRVILTVNEAYTRITGYTEAEARGQKAEFIRSGRHDHEFPQRVGSETVRSGHWEGRVWSRRKNGEIFPQFITMNALRDDSGKITNFIALHMDVTESVRAEEQIQALNEALERRVEERTRDLVAVVQELEAFSYSVSHDLRAPLRGIDGFTRIIEQKYAERLDEAGKGYLRRVRRNAARMDELIDDLLTLSRVTRSPFSSGVVDVSAIARAILADLSEANPERPVVLKVEDGASIVGDQSLLRVVLENLIGNAWKYSARRDKTEIEVGTIMTEHGKAVFVRDHGAGFDMRYADKLFVAFQRLHSSMEFEGSGIGLAIVQRVINRHGGKIWAEGAVGIGSTFYFVV